MESEPGRCCIAYDPRCLSPHKVLPKTSGYLRIVLSIEAVSDSPGPVPRLILLFPPKVSRQSFSLTRGRIESDPAGRGRLGLSEQLPDLSVDVAEEVHVGGAAVQALILHQELTEEQLGFVLLPHNVELRDGAEKPAGDETGAEVLFFVFFYIFSTSYSLWF